MHVKKYRKKTYLKKCGPQTWLYLCFESITLKQLNSLTLIHTFSFLGGQEVMYQTAVGMVPSSVLIKLGYQYTFSDIASLMVSSNHF